MKNNLSNHPIHVLKNGRGSQQSEDVSTPLPQNGLVDERNLMSVEGTLSDVGYLGVPHGGNLPYFIGST